MNNITFYPFGDTAALRFAAKYLYDRGLDVTEASSPRVTHLILPVPGFDADGNIRGGGCLEQILSQLPVDATILGGNLQHPTLAGRKTLDLLQDEQYLAENAAITADCAVRIAGKSLPVVFDRCPFLIIGWGRIGKCLAFKLKALGADVTVAARKEYDRAAIVSLGFRAVDTGKLHSVLPRCRVIFNTAPSPILTAEQAASCHDSCVKIDLASKQGIFGEDVIWARGLPNKIAPESSGALIARTILRLIAEKEALL